MKEKKESENSRWAEFQRRLDMFSCMVRIRCRWLTAGKLWLPEPELEEAPSPRRDGFCARVKACKGGETHCGRNDSHELAERIRSGRKGFVHECHAGAAEIVVPIGDAAAPAGAVVVGPFRRAGAVCRCAPAQAEFDKLPVLEEPEIAGYLEFVPQLFTGIAECVRCEPTGTIRVPPDDPRIAKVLKLLRDNPAIPMNRLAEEIGLSRSRLFHVFREGCGVSLGSYMLRLRLRAARRYLLYGGWTLQQIARHTGFADQSHFTMSFRREFGMTPARYRRKTLSGE